MEITYKYISKEPFDEKINYSYSDYNGWCFIDEWKKYRSEFICYKVEEIDLNKKLTYSDNMNESNTYNIFKNIYNLIMKEDESAYNIIDVILKRFEITKKIFSGYDDNYKCINNQCNDIELYKIFSIVLIIAYEKKGKLQYLNSLIKINDIICSYYLKGYSLKNDILQYIIAKEIKIIDNLIYKVK